nr:MULTISPECIES: hypothetical protein [unclassified Myxococcus]
MIALGLGLFGAQALAGYAPYADGHVLRASDTTNRYVVAGGARFLIPAGEWIHYVFAPSVTQPQATINTYEVIPRDGTLIRELSETAIYVVVGAKDWWVPNPTELGFWDDTTSVNNVPTGSRDVFPMLVYSALIQDRTSSDIYLFVAGAVFPVTTPADLAYFGGSSAVKVVPLGTVGQYTNEVYCGTLLRERSSSTVYYMGYRSSSPTMWKGEVTGVTADGVVPDGALSSFPLLPGIPSCIW